jgi:hypothetical protein
MLTKEEQMLFVLENFISMGADNKQILEEQEKLQDDDYFRTWFLFLI